MCYQHRPSSLRKIIITSKYNKLTLRRRRTDIWRNPAESLIFDSFHWIARNIYKQANERRRKNKHKHNTYYIIHIIRKDILKPNRFLFSINYFMRENECERALRRYTRYSPDFQFVSKWNSSGIRSNVILCT